MIQVTTTSRTDIRCGRDDGQRLTLGDLRSIVKMLESQKVPDSANVVQGSISSLYLRH